MSRAGIRASPLPRTRGRSVGIIRQHHDCLASSSCSMRFACTEHTSEAQRRNAAGRLRGGQSKGGHVAWLVSLRRSNRAPCTRYNTVFRSTRDTRRNVAGCTPDAAFEIMRQWRDNHAKCRRLASKLRANRFLRRSAVMWVRNRGSHTEYQYRLIRTSITLYIVISVSLQAVDYGGTTPDKRQSYD